MIKTSFNRIWQVNYLLIPALLISFLIALRYSEVFYSNPATISIAITLDLLFTIPLVYFFLIRKKKILKLTVISWAVLGAILASYILPEEHQSLLLLFKTWGLPVVELFILGFISYKVIKLARKSRSLQASKMDSYEIITEACRQDFPRRIAAILASEIQVFYTLFFGWTNKIKRPIQFSSYKKSGIRMVLGVLIGLIFAETFVVHILIAQFNDLLAWILTLLSLYTGLQIISLIISLKTLPHYLDLEGKVLHLRYGHFVKAEVPLGQIEKIEFTRRAPKDEDFILLSPIDMLDTHNVILHFNEEFKYEGFYGIAKNCEKLGISIDDTEEFSRLLDQKISLTKTN